MISKRRGQSGFTLVELMVSLVVFAFVIAGILAMAVSMVNGYREQRDAVTAESLVRSPMDFIIDALRQASPGVPAFNITDSDTCTTSALIVNNSTSAPDSLEVIYASGGIVTESKTAFTSLTTTFDVVDPTGFAPNDYVVLTNVAQGHFFKITGVSGNTLTIQHLCGTYTASLPGGGYPAGSLVVRAQHAKFYVAALDTTTALWMDPDDGGLLAAEPLAENIEDMQIAVGIDSAADGVSENGLGGNDDEWSFNNSLDSTITIWPPATGTIRAIRLTLIAKSPDQDLGNAAAYSRPQTEDRLASPQDNYRRRILKSTVEFRNTGVSP